MQYFNIQVASQLSGVASATIRAWEKRYNAVVPERADNKHRLYSEKDIEKLALLSKLTELGQSIGKIAHLELSKLKEIYSNLLHKPYDERQLSAPSQEVDYEKMLGSFFLALMAYKLDILSHEFDKAKNLLSPRDLCLNILIPLFQEIGRKYERNELTIAQEHTLSAIVSSHLGQMIGQHYQRVPTKEKLILITTPEGELHEIGILAAALLCVHYGYKFIFLGASLPAESLSEAARALNAQVIILGVTRHDLSDSKTLDNYLVEVKKNISPGTQIWIGGNVKPTMKAELERLKIPFFPSLKALDEHLQKL